MRNPNAQDVTKMLLEGKLFENYANKDDDIKEEINGEGIYFTAHVKDKQLGRIVVIKHKYPTRSAFIKELRNNGYIVKSILDNRDLFLMDNSDYVHFSDLVNKLRTLLRDKKEYLKDYPNETSYWRDDEIKELTNLRDRALEVDLYSEYPG